MIAQVRTPDLELTRALTERQREQVIECMYEVAKFTDVLGIPHDFVPTWSYARWALNLSIGWGKIAVGASLDTRHLLVMKKTERMDYIADLVTRLCRKLLDDTMLDRRLRRAHPNER